VCTLFFAGTPFLIFCMPCFNLRFSSNYNFLLQEFGGPKKELTDLIRAKGLELGMSAVAFTKLEKSECGPAYEEWVLKG
jgi:hypothetical protein